MRIIRRADGYYVQFCINLDPRDIVPRLEPSHKAVGLDLGIKYFLALSNGKTESNPQFYRKSERQLSRANRKKSKKFRKGKKQTQNYIKARRRYARKHLRVSRQREEFAKKVALRLIQSNDLVAYEDLNVLGLVKKRCDPAASQAAKERAPRDRHLSKSISDAGWSQFSRMQAPRAAATASTFRRWLEYFGYKYGKATVAVPPQNTSQNCSSCGEKVQKSLSTRTHICPHCHYVEDRDINAAKNILQLGLSTVGHTGTHKL